MKRNFKAIMFEPVLQGYEYVVEATSKKDAIRRIKLGEAHVTTKLHEQRAIDPTSLIEVDVIEALGGE